MDAYRKVRVAAAVVLVALLVAPLAQAQTTTMPTTYSWTAPTTGSACVKYKVNASSDGGTTWGLVFDTPTSTPSYTLALPVGQTWIVRVAGIDASNRQGVFSVNSDPYTPDPGAPGAPSKPIRIP